MSDTGQPTSSNRPPAQAGSDLSKRTHSLIEQGLIAAAQATV